MPKSTVNFIEEFHPFQKSNSMKWKHPPEFPNVPPPEFPNIPPPEIESDDLIKHSPWELVNNLDLRQAAADLYISMILAEVAEVTAAQKFYDAHLEKLVEQFSRYTDMAVGGELRHSKSKLSKSQIPTPIWKALSTGVLSPSRHQAWVNWHWLRQRYGSQALRWAVQTFDQYWGGAYGGPKWAGIARTILRYEEGAYTPLTFVDTCFGLEHNGGCYFNKAHNWGWSGFIGKELENVLDLNLGGDFEGLANFCSPKLRKLFVKHKGEIS